MRSPPRCGIYDKGAIRVWFEERFGVDFVASPLSQLDLNRAVMRARF